MKERRWRRGEVVETEPSPQSVEVWWHYLFTAPADPSSRACSSDIYHHVYSINVIYISSCWRTRVTQCASPCLQTSQWKTKNKKQTIEFSSPQGSVRARGEVPALVIKGQPGRIHGRQKRWSGYMRGRKARWRVNLSGSAHPRDNDEFFDRSSRGRSWRIHKLVVVLAQYQVLLAAEYKVTKRRYVVFLKHGTGSYTEFPIPICGEGRWSVRAGCGLWGASWVGSARRSRHDSYSEIESKNIKYHSFVCM